MITKSLAPSAVRQTMGFPTFPLDLDLVETRRRLFSDEIDKDEWMMFHGTSGLNAESIERDGFDAATLKVLPEDIRQVMTVFEKMKWLGSDPGGYQVLKAYSFGYDFYQSQKSPLFFAEASMRGLFYSSRDYSGGEKLRAIRRAFGDLDSYLDDPSLRQRNWNFLQAQFNCLSSMNASLEDLEAVRPVEVDLAWLEQQLEGLSEIHRMAEDIFERHDHGVVYALRMAPEDVKMLKWNGGMGIESRTPISSSKIVAKVIVPHDYVMNQPSRSVGDIDLRQSGLLAALRAKN